jgi:hypothetical protein
MDLFKDDRAIVVPFAGVDEDIITGPDLGKDFG